MSALSKTELRKKIADILKGADLAKTTGKKVREELEEDLGVDLKPRKKEIDTLVMEYVKAHGSKNGDVEDEDAEEEENEDEDDEEEEEEDAKGKQKGVKRGAAGKKSPAKKAKKDDSEDDASEHSDEESDDYAPKKSKPPKARKLPPKKKRGSDSDSDEDYKKEKSKKRGGGGAKRGGGGYTKALKLSPELADLVGQESMARHEVVKKVWAIIKERELFDPKNRQFAICDAPLLKVIGTKRFRTFGMMKYLKNHFVS